VVIPTFITSQDQSDCSRHEDLTVAGKQLRQSILPDLGEIGCRAWGTKYSNQNVSIPVESGNLVGLFHEYLRIETWLGLYLERALNSILIVYYAQYEQDRSLD